MSQQMRELKEPYWPSSSAVSSYHLPTVPTNKTSPASPSPSIVFSLTSHEEEKPSHILHKASVPAAAQDTDDPAKEDDGHCHAHEASCHSTQICEEAGGKELALEHMIQSDQVYPSLGQGEEGTSWTERLPIESPAQERAIGGDYLLHKCAVTSGFLSTGRAHHPVGSLHLY